MQSDFFTLAPAGCFVLDAAGRILEANPAGEALLGGTPSDLRGRLLADHARPDDRARLAAFLRRAGTAPQRLDLWLQRAGGPAFCARLDAVRGEGPEAPLYVVLLDATCDHATRAALAASEARLVQAVLEAPLPVAVYTEDGDILALSRMWTESTGYTAGELTSVDAWIERAFGRREAAAMRQAHDATVQALFEHQGRLHGGEVEIRTRDGRRRLWDFHSAPLPPLPDGRRAVITMAMDVTAWKQIQAELVKERDRAEEMARLKSAFLANMSHEIRTPLTGIIGFAAVLAKELPAEHQEFAHLIEGSGRRLLDMLNSVLDLAKLEANQVELQLERLDLAQEAREVVLTLQPLADQRGLTLAFEAAEGAAHAAAYLDRPALGRILHNLVGNALKFTEHGGVTVRLDADAEHVNLHVVDTGIGIDPMFLPYLFDEFRQESTGASRTHGGSGLGLAITKRLVELLRGRITVASEKGRGSTFSVSFVRAPEPAEPDPSDEDRRDDDAVPAPPPRARLLLVEDNLDAQYLLLELLDEQYDVTLASTAAETLHLARHTRFDLILMDIQLGEGPDGTDVLRVLRALPDYRDTPIVALTAYALPGDRERFLEMGFTAYLSKPFDIDELLRLPAQLLAQ